MEYHRTSFESCSGGGCVRLASSNTCCRKLVLASFFDHHLFHAVRVATLVKLVAGWIPAPPSCTAASIRLARTHSLEHEDINSRSNSSLSSTHIDAHSFSCRQSCNPLSHNPSPSTAGSSPTTLPLPPAL